MPFAHIPAAVRGPRPVPLLGSFGSVLRFFSDPVGQMLALHREFGPIAALADGSATMVCAFGSALNRDALSQPALFENSSEIPVVPPPGSSLERFNRVLP